jgi:hypothetical protein
MFKLRLKTASNIRHVSFEADADGWFQFVNFSFGRTQLGRANSRSSWLPVRDKLHVQVQTNHWPRSGRYKQKYLKNI